MKKFLLPCMMALGIGVSAQITVSEGFEGTALPTGWASTTTGTGTSTNPSGYGTSAGTACVGAKTVYKNIYGTTYTGWNMTYSSTTSNATALSYSFKYLAKGYSTTGDIGGTVAADYSIDGGTTWVDILAPVTLSSPNATPIPCTTVSGTIPTGTIPAGANFKFRLKSTSTTAADFYMGFDDVQLSQIATTVPSCTTISAPANAATGVSVTPTISWATASGASSYVLKIGSTPGGTDVMNNVDVGNVTSYAIPAASSLSYSKQYYITIAPKNSFGSATGCTETSFTTVAIPCPVVTAPVSGASGLSTTPTISWTALTGATGYKLSVGTTSGGTDVLNNSDLGNVTSYTFSTPLMTGTQYYYTLNSYSATSVSTSCSQRAFTTLCTTTTSVPYTQNFEGAVVPGLPTCTSNQNAGTGNNWAVTSNNGYGFTTKAITYTYNSTNAANAWFFTQGINLVAGTQYTISYKYGGTGTSFPEKLKVNYGTSASAAAMTTNLADYPNVVNDTPITASVNFTPTTSGIYYFGFNCYSAADKFYLSVDDISVNSAALATSEAAQVKNNLSVYPNPFTDVLNISDVKNVKSVSVLDIAGRLVKTIEKPNSALQLGDLKSGMFVVVLNMNDGSKQTIKVIKK